MNIPKEIADIRESYLNADRIRKRAEFEEEAKKELLKDLNNFSYQSFETFSELVNSDYCGGEICKDRFGNLFSTPNMDLIKTKNDPKKIKELIEIVLKKDFSSIDRILEEIYGINYGVASLLFYVQDSNQFNVFLGSTLAGLKVIFPELAKDIVYGKPFNENYIAFNKLCNELKNQYGLKPQELD